MKITTWTTLGAALLIGGCASTPVPADRLASSEAAIRSAQELGAEKVPNAALHLKEAKEELDLAKKLIADGDNKRAKYVLGRAEADGEVALSFAREQQARDDAAKTLAEVQKLKNSSINGGS